MPHNRIQIDVARLDAYYENMMDEVYMMFHVHPSNLTHVNLSPSELAEIQYYEGVGRGAIDAHSSGGGGQGLGGHGYKQVWMPQADTVNGLPRHR